MSYNEDIFIIDSWPDNESKEKDLINLINLLKEFNTTILLCGHYPIKPEIQRMVDYFIFDKVNPILHHSEYDDYGVSSGHWTKTNKWDANFMLDFHHDYAIWTTMRNAFNFSKYLGKKYIHFLEYDNLPDPVQYRQSFLEPIRNHDAVIYEYSEGSTTNRHLGEFCATFIFSIKTDVAISLIDKIKSKKEYYKNRPTSWQLEKLFLKYLKDTTNNIFLSKYIANNNELNTQAVWNRDRINRNGGKFQIYLVTDGSGKLFIHFVSGFTDVEPDKDFFVEINYDEFKQFYTIKKHEYSIIEIGDYKKDHSVKVYYMGVEVFNEVLSKDYDEFKKLNSLTFHEDHKPRMININFIDGPFAEILNDENRDYHVDFINTDKDVPVFSLDMKSNHWSRANAKYFINWKIKITSSNFTYEYNYDASDKNVLISFESKSIGDTLAWIPYVEEFRKVHNCNVICSTFHNNLFKETYPNIKFVPPGTTVNNLYALYRLGYFYNNNEYDINKHPSDPKTKPLQMIASDILGLEFKEIKPELKNYNLKKVKLVTIGFHSTAQAKYWNNPSGWQDVTNYLVKKGYDVLILSREEDGYMGNYFPKKTTKFKLSPLEDIMKVIQKSELYIGVSSGLSWVSWACKTPTVLISGFTDKQLEPQDGIHRVINENVCHGCWSTNKFDPSDWNWCPFHKGTDRQFECSKMISSNDVIKEIKKIIGDED